MRPFVVLVPVLMILGVVAARTWVDETAARADAAHAELAGAVRQALARAPSGGDAVEECLAAAADGPLPPGTVEAIGAPFLAVVGRLNGDRATYRSDYAATVVPVLERIEARHAGTAAATLARGLRLDDHRLLVCLEARLTAPDPGFPEIPPS